MAVYLSQLIISIRKIKKKAQSSRLPIAAFYTNLMQCAMTAFTTLDKVIKALTFWGLWKDMSRLHAQLLILQLRRRVSEAEAAERGYYYTVMPQVSRMTHHLWTPNFLLSLTSPHILYRLV